MAVAPCPSSFYFGTLNKGDTRFNTAVVAGLVVVLSMQALSFSSSWWSVRMLSVSSSQGRHQKSPMTTVSVSKLVIISDSKWILVEVVMRAEQCVFPDIRDTSCCSNAAALALTHDNLQHTAASWTPFSTQRYAKMNNLQLNNH